MECGRPLYQGRIITAPEILVGKPVIKGTRISVALVLEYLANNPNFDEFFTDYPEVSMDDVRACLAYGQALAAGEQVTPAPRRRPHDDPREDLLVRGPRRSYERFLRCAA